MIILRLRNIPKRFYKFVYAVYTLLFWWLAGCLDQKEIRKTKPNQISSQDLAELGNISVLSCTLCVVHCTWVNRIGCRRGLPQNLELAQIIIIINRTQGCQRINSCGERYVLKSCLVRGRIIIIGEQRCKCLSSNIKYVSYTLNPSCTISYLFLTTLNQFEQFLPLNIQYENSKDRH